MVLNEKGQEFSVFKLLISAIVAVVILGILISLINPGIFDPTNTPFESAKKVLGEIDNVNYQEKISNKYFVFQQNQSINSKALAETSGGLSDDQICLTLLDDLESKGFNLTGTSLISYPSSSEIRVKIVGVCGEKDEFVSGDLVSESAPTLLDKGFDFSGSGCESTCPDEQKCCVMALIKSNE